MLSPRDAAAAVVRGVGRDGVRDDLRELLPGLAQDVLGQDVLAGDPRDGIGPGLAIDETADLRKGRSAGTQRQYTGTARRTENAQVAVYLAYAARTGTAFIDRALYLPRSWTSDQARCRAAGVPRDTAFATKPALARAMITRALDAGTPAAWVTA